MRVALVEASGRLGGKVRTERIGPLLVEPGPDSLFRRDRFALDLLEQLGLGIRSSAPSLRRGLSSLVECLRKACPNTTIHLGTPVAVLAPDRGDARFELRLADGRRLLADDVILATPAFAAGDLLKPLSPLAAAELRAIRYASAIVVVLAYSPGVKLPTGSGFLVAPGEPSLMAACSWSSHKWPHCAPSGEVLVRCHLHPDGRPEISALDDQALVDALRAELRRVAGLQAEPLLTRVYRWPRAVASYGLGHRERLRTIDAALAEVPGVVLAGAGYRGVGLPDCLRQGVAAAERVLGAPVGLGTAYSTG